MTRAPIEKAVILARGLGTRMRKQAADAGLTGEQAAVAETGIKALIPIDRPFLDYVLSVLADAGYRRVCMVIGPEHEALRHYYTKELKLKRLTVEFAIQEKPLGTANAVSAVEAFADGDGFLVINSDNYYPLAAVKGLREIHEAGTALFEKDGMLAGSNIPAERLISFAVAEASADGYLKRIIEKPSAEVMAALPQPVGLSMNCWRFDSSIFEACRKIKPSPRGELELPDAVQYAMEKLGTKFRVLMFKAPVLDLSSRSDVGPVTQRLKGTKVSL